MHDEKKDRMVQTVLAILKGDLANRHEVGSVLLAEMRRTTEAGILDLNAKATTLRAKGVSQEAIVAFLDTSSALVINELLTSLLAPVILSRIIPGGTA